MKDLARNMTSGPPFRLIMEFSIPVFLSAGWICFLSKYFIWE